jgi:hypothetical protein
MKIKQYILALVLFSFVKTFSQPIIVPYRVSSNWTFYKSSTKNLFKESWDTVYMYSSNVAWVKRNQKFGLIDTSGKYVYALQLDSISEFYQGVAKVKNKSDRFWINTKGQVLEKEPNLSYGCGGVKGYGSLAFGDYKLNNKYGLIINRYDYEKKLMVFDTLPAKYDKLLDVYSIFIKTLINNKIGLTSLETGKDITNHIYDNIEFNNEENDGSPMALHKATIDGRVGFINQKGKLIIKCKYKTATVFYNGLSLVSNNDKIYYFINYKGFEYYSKNVLNK